MNDPQNDRSPEAIDCPECNGGTGLWYSDCCGVEKHEDVSVCPDCKLNCDWILEDLCLTCLGERFMYPTDPMQDIIENEQNGI